MKSRFLIFFLLLGSSGFGQDISPTTLGLIRSTYDSGKFAETATLLAKLKTENSDIYTALPFALMRAKALEKSGDVGGALAAYSEAANVPSLAPFALLPLARLAAIKDDQALAVTTYQQYLSLKKPPEYASAVREALDYCVRIAKPDYLRKTAEIVRRDRTFGRLGELYAARSHLLRGDVEQAKILLQGLIRQSIKDDVTSLALTELDLLEGSSLTEATRVSRGVLAYRVWNFDLTRKYLQPYALRSMENAYYYARSLAFAGQTEEARKTYQAAIGMWPEDSMYRLAVYQYANLCLRQGDNVRAAELFSRVRSGASGEMLENSTFNLVQAFRAQNKIDEALKTLGPFSASKKRSQRERALFLRARVNYQGKRFSEALNDIRQLTSPKSTLNQREVQYWKGMILEKLNMREDADLAFSSLARGHDFFAFQVTDRWAASGKPVRSDSESAASSASSIRLCQLPQDSQEMLVIDRARAGDMLMPFLFVHLYDEASRVLGSVTPQSWDMLQVSSTDRPQKLVCIAYLAGLGRNYPTSTYYSEIFLKTLSNTSQILELQPDVQRALFPLPYQDVVRKFSSERKVDPFLILSIMKQESKFKEFARSPAFARGLMQLIPSTATQIATDLGVSDFSLDQLYRPDININFGTHYVQDMISKFGSRLEVIAASYNSGESNVRRWLACTSTDEVMEFYSNIDLPETKNYVHIVKTNYELYRQVYGSELAQSAN